LLTRIGRAPAAREQSEALVETLGDRGEREIARAAGGEFQRERNSIQSSRDLGRMCEIVAAQFVETIEISFAQTVDQHLEGRPSRGFFSIRERFDAYHALAIDLQCFARRRYDDGVSTIVQDALDHTRSLVDEMLAVIKDKEHALRPDRIDHRLDQRHVRLFAHVEYACDRRCD